MEIEVGKQLVLDDPDGKFTVTAFDANHCPGAVMFLFEGRFGNILHTGDCRLLPDILQCLPEKYVSKKGRKPSCPLDYIFLDCTFGGSSFKMPSRQLAIQQVINCIWKHPSATRVYLTCDVLGQEEILSQVYQTFGCKIYLDKEKDPKYFQSLALLVSEVLTEDSSSRFHLFDGFPRLYERAEAKIAEAKSNDQPEPLIIRPSAQWYVCEESDSESQSMRKRCNQAIRDTFGVWHVCYSMHSSGEELDWALELLSPKWVISTTPSCRAMELDYVRKHCFNSHDSSNSLTKLLDIAFITPTASPSKANSPVKCLRGSPIAETILTCDVESHTQSIVASTSCRHLFNPSPNGKQTSVTLFGRARLGIQHSLFENDQETKAKDNKSSEIAEYIGDIVSHRESEDTSHQIIESVEFEHQRHLKTKNTVIEEDAHFLSTKMRKYGSDRTVGSSKNYGESLRRLYSSMNVAVPQPLPSLVEMMNGKRYAKRRM